MAPDQGPTQGDRLHGWKEIAAYLGKSVRSVQRWEDELGLPVRRIRTDDGQIVSASRAEIDAWRLRLESLPAELATDPVAEEPETVDRSKVIPPPEVRSSRPRILLWISAAVCAVPLTAAFWWWPSSAKSPSASIAEMVFVGRTLQARDHSGGVLWKWQFDGDVSRPLPYQQERVSPDARLAEVDLDGDGDAEHVVAVRFGPSGEPAATTDAVYAFSATGGPPRWVLRPDTVLSCPTREYEGPWSLKAVRVSSQPGPKRVWAAFAHHTYSPSFVMEMMPDGRSGLRYLQNGWVMSLAEWQTADGLHLVAGGVLHPHDRPSVVLLNPNGPAAISPDVPPALTCAGAPTALPRRVTLLPNLDLAAAQGAAYLMVDRLKLAGDDLLAEPANDFVATISPDSRVQVLTFSDAYWATHRRLEGEGKIAHSLLVCPETQKPQEVQIWTEKGGWFRATVGTTNHPKR